MARRYQRSDGERVDAPEATLDAILAAMGADDGDGPPDAPGVRVVHAGEKVDLGRPVRLTTEDGGELDLDGPLPTDLPIGYHTVTDQDDGSEVRLIVSPGRCLLPEGRGWGWAVQLYAARSRASWGIGDLADLRRLGEWAAGQLGARLLLLNPLHDSLPGLPQTASPYYPSSRQFRNPLFLRVEEVPGASELGVDLDKLAGEGRALNGDRHIDRDAVYRLKREALNRLWDGFAGDRDFDSFCAAGGSSLEGYATFCTLSEEFGRPWWSWPEEYRTPDREEVERYRADNQGKVRFHQWLQWLVDGQLARAGEAVSLIEDLAVGVDPAGADGWLWQGVLASGMSVGAPADEFNTQGQDWGVPPFDPWKLRAAAYTPFVETIRASLHHGGGMRLDHVMGLFRLFWVPHGASAKEGTYVRYPASDLLDIVALESHRAGAYVVGEDLGTVEEEVRVELAARNILSYRLLWFESAPPAEWPVHALAAVTTHDLPTVAGLWQGSDLEAQRSRNLEPNEESTAATRKRLAQLAGGDGDAAVEDVIAAAYDTLSQAPCLLLTGTLEDALGVEERPNMPGTTDQWPNWSIALPAPLEEIEDHPGARRIARALTRPELP